MSDEKRVGGQEVADGIVFVEKEAGIAEYRLTNGMKLLFAEQSAAPVVAFIVVYHVGSRNEAVGHTGATHLLEHMLFKGTPEFNTGKGTQIAAVLKRIGAQFNATTWYDRTNYFEAVPKDQLELVIHLEADRMRNSLILDEDRESERIVVRNEMERGENEPLHALAINCWAIAFREHPYHHPTIGWRDDVENVPTERLREFYHTFYWPNNATAVIVGDVPESDALGLMVKHFGKVPASPHLIPQVYTQEPKQEGERRFTLHRAGEVGIVQIGYHTPEAQHPDIFSFSLLSRILTDGVTSRLYQRLVDCGLAISVSAHVTQLCDPGLFEMTAMLRPGIAHHDVEALMIEEIARIRDEGVLEAELARAKRKVEADVYFARDGVMNFALALGESESCADWKWFLNYVPSVRRVKNEDIQQVIREYLHERNRTVGWFVPKQDGSSQIVE